MNGNWHSLSVDEILRQLSSSREGLSAPEAAKRLADQGQNRLVGKKRVPPIVMFLRQFLNPLIYVLIAAVIIKAILKSLLDAGVIVAVLLLMAVIGFVQETRAEKAMEALLQLAAPKAKVRRGGRVQTIPAEEIVTGDVILLEAGDKVPADARLMEASSLKVGEAPLTGESMPVDKHTETLSEETPVADRKNMLFMGTAVNSGRATAVVVATGMNTEIGRIASAIRETKTQKTPLQQSISRLSRYVLVLVLGACAVLFIAGLLEGLPVEDVFLLAVTAAVSAIPEGLPATVTVTLAVGMKEMAQRNAIIRRLVAVETLGAATVICSDKTGTLTLNQMTVRRIYVDGHWVEVTGEGYQPQGQFLRDGKVLSPDEDGPLALLLRIGALCNDALLAGEMQCCDVIGDPTEGALVVVAAKAGLDKERLQLAYPRVDEIPFQSEKQYMATLHTRNGGRVAYVKGSLERLLSFSAAVIKDGALAPLTAVESQALVDAGEAMARDAMRVLAIGCAEFPAEHLALKEEDIRGHLTLVGLVGMADPPREEARVAVGQCREAGIRVVMATGDNKVTAESVARQLELPPGRAVTGAELQQMTDDELRQEVKGVSVFARIEPLHKLRIVNAFKSQGEVVAMTGDGVNDAPALKASSIGVAMGITGTDVAKEASDMVLADDNFASVVAAVEEGRAIFNRLRNVTLFLLTTGLGELVALILCVSVLGLAPLLPLQIIWVNLVTGVIVAVPLGMEPKTGYELKQPPRHPRVGLVYPGLLLRLAFLALMLSIGVFLAFNWAQSRSGLDEARTIAFCAVIVFEWLVAFNARSDEFTIFRLGIFHNVWLVRAVLLAIPLQMAVVYAPPLQAAFKTVALGIDEWGMALLPGVCIFVLETSRKLVFPRAFSLGKWQPLGKKA
ncbi:MAG: HAD-IC family P-type ATPase [Dehalococcoidia bacterium]|nr:HAD-IC family P-type ATPase [Dehalococcoidia bacterium]